MILYTMDVPGYPVFKCIMERENACLDFPNLSVLSSILDFLVMNMDMAVH